jgi:hypothetical protein
LKRLWAEARTAAALCRFIEEGRIEHYNDPVERAIRPVALGSKNHLFAGSDGGGERRATDCSLIATARLRSVFRLHLQRQILRIQVISTLRALDETHGRCGAQNQGPPNQYGQMSSKCGS